MKPDEYYMRIAVALASLGRPYPNPRVGCVIVDEHHNIVGRGYHAEAGKSHAEVIALADAKHTPFCTAYVTLEPCAHWGRTPPCVDALLDAQVRRVVIGTLDPNPIAHGGADKLRDAGVEVTVGVLEEECLALLSQQNICPQYDQKVQTINRMMTLYAQNLADIQAIGLALMERPEDADLTSMQHQWGTASLTNRALAIALGLIWQVAGEVQPATVLAAERAMYRHALTLSGSASTAPYADAIARIARWLNEIIAPS